MRRCRLLLAGGVLFAVAMGTSRAPAQGRIQVPDGCGSEPEFRSEIERLTGSSAAEAALSSLRIEARPGAGAGYELRLVVGDEVRILSDPQCRILWRSALVIVAAAARSESEAEPPPIAAPPDPASPAPPAPSAAPRAPNDAAAPSAPAPARPPAPLEPAAMAPPRPRAVTPRALATRARSARPRRAPSRPSRRVAPIARLDPPERVEPAARASVEPAAPALGVFHPGLALGVGVSGGVLPDLGSVLDASGRIEVLPWAFDVSIRYWPLRSEAREGRGVDVSAWGARVAGLYRVASALNLFAGIEVNRLVGEGTDGVSGRGPDAVWQWAPTLGFNLITWDIGSLRIEAGAAARISVARPRFVVTGFGDVYRVPVLGADAIIRGVWLFR